VYVDVVQHHHRQSHQRAVSAETDPPSHHPVVDRAARDRVLAGPDLPAATADAVRLLDQLLDGHRPGGDALGAALTGGLEPAAVAEAWGRLVAAGALREGPDPTPIDPRWADYADQARTLAVLAYAERDAEASAWQRAGGELQKRLAAAAVVVAGAGSAWRRVAEDLEVAGVGTLSPVDDADLTVPERCDLVVHVSDDPRPDRRLQIGRSLTRAGVPAVFYHRDQGDIVVGPFVYPGQTACVECVELRRAAARSGWAPAGEPMPPPLLRFPVGTDLLALDVVKFLSEAALPATRGRVVRFDLRVGVPSVHPVLRLPRCPACGAGPAAPVRRLWSAADAGP
jgi:bacteriocin biosynthesis cyclodehydratase domain-containing protein